MYAIKRRKEKKRKEKRRKPKVTFLIRLNKK